MTTAILSMNEDKSLWRITAAHGDKIEVASERPMHLMLKTIDGENIVSAHCAIESARKDRDGSYRYVLRPTAIT